MATTTRARPRGRSPQANGKSPRRQRPSSDATQTVSRDATQTVSEGGTGVGHSVGEAGKTAAKFVALPMASAAAGAVAGMVGGMVLERRGFNRKRRKVLGVRLPGRTSGLDGLARQVGKAGDQFGKLALEVRTTREKVGEAGKALS